ncbi:hypothetical protein GLOIN_2v1676879 [Rhizophagus irregularis DAOM 181602=DAOM 197198]|uniref:Uncharacterized protein n=3 Tax=Rhizophagus irregularis TaxID=588596 RepID=A0A2P4PG45_RHIID|nr:hypothetical protein GLOIN_2v1676879 [Rhizophagus irregularis DAOM 181602=DAOM 197198]POG64366.1 hypothetical protein GLOIN_2v1676879 [Rhizophagus irregularis DAOM 181602=DAOM 197198]|eukprot:XP_025171232.1 hypothetical protein GLOIN_2v1676879 [Rhizophagus irregularis DAOM 181602=DAOM 197198]
MWKFPAKKLSEMFDKTEVPDKPKTSDKLEKFLLSEEASDIFEVPISNANNNRVSSLADEIPNSRINKHRKT